MAQWYAQVNGQRFGPASEEDMKSWVAQGRVKPTDYVWADGMANWVTAASAFGLTTSTAGGAADPGYPQPAYSPMALPNAPYAVASMVCGIIGVVLDCLYGIGFILGIIAFVLARKSKEAIRRNPGQFGGEGMATAGFVLGIIGTIIGILYLLGMICFFAFFFSKYNSQM